MGNCNFKVDSHDDSQSKHAHWLTIQASIRAILSSIASSARAALARCGRLRGGSSALSMP